MHPDCLRIFGQLGLSEKLTQVSFVFDRQEDWCGIAIKLLDFKFYFLFILLHYIDKLLNHSAPWPLCTTRASFEATLTQAQIHRHFTRTQVKWIRVYMEKVCQIPTRRLVPFTRILVCCQPGSGRQFRVRFLQSNACNYFGRQRQTLTLYTTGKAVYCCWHSGSQLIFGRF